MNEQQNRLIKSIYLGMRWVMRFCIAQCTKYCTASSGCKLLSYPGQPFWGVSFYGLSTIIGYLMPNFLYTYTLNIHGLVWFDFINHCKLFNAKFSLFIYIEYIFGLVGFYGLANSVGYLMLNTLYTNIVNTQDLVWLGFMAYQPL